MPKKTSNLTLKISLLTITISSFVLVGYNWQNRSLPNAYLNENVGLITIDKQSFIDNVTDLTSEAQVDSVVQMAMTVWDNCNNNSHTRINPNTVTGCGSQRICVKTLNAFVNGAINGGTMYEDGMLRISDWEVWLSDFVNTPGRYWKTSYDYNGVNARSMYQVLSHEWGHVLGMDHDDDYIHEVCQAITYDENVLTEDSCWGALVPSAHEVLSKNIHIRIGDYDAVDGWFDWDTHLEYSSSDWKSMTTPSITGNQDGGSPGDFLIAWVHPDKQVRFAILNRYSDGTFGVYRGPVSIANAFTWNEPSIAAYADKFVIAFRDDYPNNAYQDRQGRIRLMYYDSLADTSPNAVYPMCGTGSRDYCHTMTTPKITYNKYRNRWVMAWVQSSGARWNSTLSVYERNWDEKYEVKILVSDVGNPTSWSTTPFTVVTIDNNVSQTLYGNPYGLALTCGDTGVDADSCMLIANIFGGDSGRNLEYNFSINSTGAISYESPWRIIDQNYGDRDVIATPDGWFACFAPYLNADTHNWRYRVKHDTQGISGSWNYSYRYYGAYSSYKGFDMAYNWYYGKYAYSWIE